jgi:hypothetical protein
MKDDVNKRVMHMQAGVDASRLKTHEVADFVTNSVTEPFVEEASEDDVEVEDPYNMQHSSDDNSYESSDDAGGDSIE